MARIAAFRLVEDSVTFAVSEKDDLAVAALDKKRAPVTTANFLGYVDSGKFDGEGFYRAMPLTDGGLIQAGRHHQQRAQAQQADRP